MYLIQLGSAIQTFLVSAKKPQEETRKAYEYDEMLYKRLRDLKPEEERLAGLSAAEIEDYLNMLKKGNNSGHWFGNKIPELFSNGKRSQDGRQPNQGANMSFKETFKTR